MKLFSFHKGPWNEVKWSEMKWNLVKLDRENQQIVLFNSIKVSPCQLIDFLIHNKIKKTHQPFRCRHFFHHLKDLLIVLIVVKSVDTSTRTYIRINYFEFRQGSVWVTRPHVLHELVIHPEHDQYPNLLSFQTWLTCKSDTTNLTQDKTLSQNDWSLEDPRVTTSMMVKYPNLTDWPFFIRRDSLRNVFRQPVSVVFWRRRVCWLTVRHLNPFT
jgi:hypothetical protein